jgi:S-formylglutathione hydrolase FrmB
MDVKQWSIVSAPFLATLVIATLGCIGVAIFAVRRLWLRAAFGALALVFAVTSAGAFVNAYYSYLPTVGALLGSRGVDAVSSSQFRKLDHKSSRVAFGTLGRAHVHTGLVSVQSHGVVVPFVIPSTVSGWLHPRTGQVYVPPAWFAHPHPRLPVIEMLHGSPGSPPDWTRGGAADVVADRYARAHGGVAPILVMPDVNGGFWRDTECVNGMKGNVETYLTVDVPHAVEAAFGTRTDRGGWAIAGLSEGGYCATELALRHPDQYSVAGNFSGDDHPSRSGGLKVLFGVTGAALRAKTDEYLPRTQILAWGSAPRPALWFSAGLSDHTRWELAPLSELAANHGFVTNFVLVSGRHNFGVWRASFASALPWIASHLLWESSPPPRHSRAVQVMSASQVIAPPRDYGR